MTYYSDDGGDGRREEVVPDLTVTIEADDNNSDYVKLMPSPDEDSPLAAAEEPSVPSRRSVVWYWVKLVLLFLCLGFLAAAVLKWVGPYLIDKTQPTLTQNHSALSPSHTQPFLLSHSHTQPTLTPNPRRDTQNRRIRRTHPPFLSLKIIHAFTQNPLFLSPEIIHAERTLPFSASNPLLLRNHQKGYSRLRPLSYRGADIFVLAFSLISIASYENVLKKWMPELRRFAPNVPIVLVGTKLDLRENRGYFDDHMGYNVISSAEGEELRKQIGAAAYIECSSKTQQNVKAVFDTAIKVVLQPPRRKEMATKKRHRRSGCSLVFLLKSKSI